MESFKEQSRLFILAFFRNMFIILMICLLMWYQNYTYEQFLIIFYLIVIHMMNSMDVIRLEKYVTNLNGKEIGE